MSPRVIIILAAVLFLLVLIRAYIETGKMQATGEEWERISNGYVE